MHWMQMKLQRHISNCQGTKRGALGIVTRIQTSSFGIVRSSSPSLILYRREMGEGFMGVEALGEREEDTEGKRAANLASDFWIILLI